MDKAALANVFNEIDESAKTEQFSIGDEVQTLRGSVHGTVTKVRPDSRLEVKNQKTGTEFIAPPDTLRHDKR